ncbi:hypothetical protein P9112_005327, partial [Eukaryota sp. TZLM1-RC]
YCTPVAPVIQWFPELRGFAGGLVLAGFGMGSMKMGILVVRLIELFGPGLALITLGIYGGCFIFSTSYFICKPPPGYYPKNASTKLQQSVASENSINLGKALKSFTYWKVWFTILGTTFAGVSLISLSSPILEDVFSLTEVQAGRYLAIFSTVDMSSRFFYSILSDVFARYNLCRKWLYIWLLTSQFIVCLFMTSIMTNQLLGLYIVSASVLVSGLSGGLGSLPGFLSEMFGSKSLSSLFGMTLAAWATSGLVGSQILAAVQAHGQDTGVEDHLVYIPFFKYIPILIAICLVAALTLRPYKFAKETVLPTSADNEDGSENQEEESKKAPDDELVENGHAIEMVEVVNLPANDNVDSDSQDVEGDDSTENDNVETIEQIDQDQSIPTDHSEEDSCAVSDIDIVVED